MAKVSVIVPAYNATPFMDETLASVALQTFQDWECIIVDDGSSDDTYQRALQWSQYDARFRAIQLPQNRGLPAARNAGAQAATGQYLAFLDSDDLWHPQKLEQSLQALETQQADALLTRAWRFYHETYQLHPKVLSPFLRTPNVSYQDVVMRNVRVTYPSSLVIARHAFKRIGGFDETFRSVEDMDFMVRLTRHDAHRVLLLPNLLLYYRLHAHQMHRKWGDITRHVAYIYARESKEGFLPDTWVKKVTQRALWASLTNAPGWTLKLKLLTAFCITDFAEACRDIALRFKWHFRPPALWTVPKVHQAQREFNHLVEAVRRIIAQVNANT